MRIDVKKFVFIGLKEQKDTFFKKAQELGFIHFIDMHMKPLQETAPEILNYVEAIKVLRGLPPVEQEEIEEYSKAEEIVNKILDLKERLEKLTEEERVLSLEMARVSVFGNFSLKDIHFIETEAHRKVQFFFSKKDAFSQDTLPPGIIYIASDQGLDYFIGFNEKPVVYDKLLEMQVEHPYGELKKHHLALKQEMHDIERHLKDLAKYNRFLHHSFIFLLNKTELEKAKGFVAAELDNSIFIIEGWVPKDKLRQLDELVDQNQIYCEEVAIEPKDVIPTYLENTGLGSIGEDLVHIYDTPSSQDKDPSYWILWAFALFFAFIVGDAGYGLIYLFVALFLWYKFPLVKGAARRVLKLFTILGASCILWGILTTSFFGIEISHENPIRKVALLQWLAEKNVNYHIQQNDKTYQEWEKKFPDIKGIRDPYEILSIGTVEKEGKKNYEILSESSNTVLFELALFIGIVHVILSLARYVKRNWAAIGWIVFMIGAYLYFPYYLGVPAIPNYVLGVNLQIGGEVGLELIIWGIGAAFLLAIFQHGFKGALELMIVIQIFADIMSYLRLYALALAGAIVSTTINEMAGLLPLFFGAILIIIAHFINIILGSMSGVIHGLRLNFLEWYHYSFEGGGRQFKALKLLQP